ncbi:hypothetical protein VDS34_06035 [Xanthomonas campestris pv. campestris]|nr:hypothetical protein [Xanthomonas campestris pv. campestris]
MSIAARRSTKEEDVSSLVRKIHEFTKQATQIANLPLSRNKTDRLPELREELGGALAELENTLKTLRGMVGKASVVLTKRALDQSEPPLPLVLDTTEAMILKRQLVKSDDFQNLMSWNSRQAVSKALDSQRIFYLEYNSQRYFPAFYADKKYERKHLDVITRILGDLPGGSKMQFFLTPKGSLGGATPLQALADGRFKKVKDIAAAFAEVPMEA